MLLMFLMTTLAAQAGEYFVPKDYSYEAVGSQSDKAVFVYFYDLFEFPDGMEKANLTTTEGLTIETLTGDESIVTKPTWEHYLNNSRIRFTRKGAVKGETTISVSITYNGVTATNTIPVKVLGLTTSSMTSYIEPTQTETIFDVVANTSFFSDNERSHCSISIDNVDEIRYGVAEVVDGESGHKVIKYTQTATQNKIVSDLIRYTITLSDGVDNASNKITAYITKNCFASRVIEYAPAAGQFRVEEAWDKPNIISDKSTNTKGVSLGGLGGYIIWGFDQPIYNDPQNPYGVDFTIKGNSFIAAEKGVWTEPGAVQVMEDINGNGIPDDGEWYELAGSDYWLSTTKHNVEITYYNPHYNGRYTVPWSMTYTDKNGNKKEEYGAILSNSFHEHTFYPDYYYNNDNPNESNRWYNPVVNRDSITFSGISEIRGCIDMRTPSYIEFYTVAGFGYCDNKGFNESDLRVAQNPYGRPSLGEDANDGMDISWAVDKNGNYVNLEKIDFVKVYTAGNKNAGWLGEWSTEVLNCAITLPDPEYIPQDYYYNYVGITQLQVPLGHTCQYEGFLFKNGRPVQDAEQRWWLTDAEGNPSAEIDAIATIDNTGLFTALAPGKVWVHFSGKEGITEEWFEVNVVNLTNVVISLEGYESTVSDDQLQCVKGERIYINVESEDNSETELNGTKSNRYIYDSYTWINSNPEVGVMDNGSFTALSAGTTILTAVSNTNNALNDQIKITVVEAPELKVRSASVAADQPVGELLNTAFFDISNNATVYMEEVTSLRGFAEVSLYNNHLYYSFEEGKYATDVLRFKVTYYGKQYEVDVPFSYGPYNLAGNKKLLVSYLNSENETVITGIDAETFETKEYVKNLGATPVDNILTDGSFAYVSQGTALNRYNVERGVSVASVALDDNSNHVTTVYKDKLIVTDGNCVKVMYKTDLQAFRTIDLSGKAIQMTVSGDNAYILVENGDAVKIATLDMTSWTLTTDRLEMERGSEANAIYHYGDKLYLPVGASEGKNASMTIFNLSNKSASTVSYASDYNTDTKNISSMVGENILVSCSLGFVEFNIPNGTFGSDLLLYNGFTMPISISGEMITSDDETFPRYYVAYEDMGMFAIDSMELANVQPIGELMPNVMTIMAATAENNAPTVKMSGKNYKTYSATSGIYERTTSAKSCTSAALKNYFEDKEGVTSDNIWMYIREDVEWLTVDYATDGKMTPKVTYTGDVDDVTDYVFELECIDKNGASVKTTATFRITPRIYKPAIVEPTISIKSSSATTGSVAVTDVFNYTKTKTNLTFTTEVTNISDNTLIESAVIDEDGNLVVTVPTGAIGSADVELTQTISHKTYGSKSFTAICKVNAEPTLVETITLDATAATLKVAETMTLTATVLPEDATIKDVIWTSSDDSIATVDNGVVTAHSLGTAIITVATTDGSNLTATCEVTVEPTLVETITLDLNAAMLKVDETVTLTATVLPEDATIKDVVWTSSDDSIATVDNGVVTAHSVGTAIITVATTDGSNLTATCEVTVEANEILIERIELNYYTLKANIGDTVELEATVYPEEATDKSLQWTVSNENVVKLEQIDNFRVQATFLVQGGATITVSTLDGSAISAICVIDILTSIDMVLNDLQNGVEYYTLDGVKIEVENIASGIYLRKQGDKISKVIIR